MEKEHAARYFNRELSWIEFNARVLAEACNKDVPLLERLKFLAIVSSNFDEFCMVRVAGLKRQTVSAPDRRDISGLTAKEQLARISKRIHEVLDVQYDCFLNDILPALADEGIICVSPADYTQQQRDYLDSFFQSDIFPLLTPLRVDHDCDFPHIGNLRLNAAFLLAERSDMPLYTRNPIIREAESAAQKCDILQTNSRNTENGTDGQEPAGPTADSGEASTANGEEQTIQRPLAIVQIPTSVSQIVWIPGDEDKNCFTFLGDVVATFGSRLFPGYTVQETMLFKLTRDADFAVDEDRETDFIEAMEEVIEGRQSSVPVRFICNKGSDTILSMLRERINFYHGDIYQVTGPVDMTSLMALSSIEGYDHLKNSAWKNFWAPSIPQGTPLWDELKRTDLMLHVPYESYEPVIRFISDASEDPNVLAIKMTLYRTSGNSPIIRALERAARNGKQVTAFVELKARFDEKQNISWAAQLEKAGVIVVYGIAQLKVHAKMLLVVRREPEGIRRYVHLSTGNYNDKTARMYSDISLFTCNAEIANDATLFFNMISGYSSIQSMKRLAMAPTGLKLRLLYLIDREIKRSSEDTPGLIMAKMNSLADPDIIEALYRASGAGVRVLLNVRGICMLVPGVEGQSENIAVISIVDRILEHARIIFFQNGGAEEMYLSSADWMPRNLDRRVELLFPVLQEELFQKLKDILLVYFSDNTKARYLQSNGEWLRVPPSEGEPIVRAQEKLYEDEKELVDAQDREIPHEFVVRRTDH